MSYFLTNILPALLAGGLAGQLLTLAGTNWFASKREFRKWLLAEKFKLFSEMMLVCTRIPKDTESQNKWTYEIRELSQKIMLLYEDGVPPAELSDAMEVIFQLAKQKKDGSLEADWSSKQRDAARILRKVMSSQLGKI